jgi:mRNA-degrading endonuclease RelE of RelBE toxin-antitoxin system
LTAGWRVEFTPKARRELRRTDPPVERRIVAALERLTAEPRSVTSSS